MSESNTYSIFAWCHSGHRPGIFKAELISLYAEISWVLIGNLKPVDIECRSSLVILMCNR